MLLRVPLCVGLHGVLMKKDGRGPLHMPHAEKPRLHHRQIYSRPRLCRRHRRRLAALRLRWIDPVAPLLRRVRQSGCLYHFTKLHPPTSITTATLCARNRSFSPHGHDRDLSNPSALL